MSIETAMSGPRSDFLQILHERGYVHQCSDVAGLDAKAQAGEVVAYVGYDCTAPSLHVGHLLSIMMLHFRRTGRDQLETGAAALGGC
jgi:tyrosyl-tRNA synthetase